MKLWISNRGYQNDAFVSLIMKIYKSRKGVKICTGNVFFCVPYVNDLATNRIRISSYLFL